MGRRETSPVTTPPRRTRAALGYRPGESGALSVIIGLIVIGVDLPSLNGHSCSR